MAEAAAPLNQNLQLAALMANLGSSLFGKPPERTTTSGGTVSEQTLVDPAQILKLLAQDPSTGVAATANAAKRAGVYGGSTYMNLNDLLSQIGTRAAIAAAPKVRVESGSTAQKKQAGLINPLTGALLAGGLFALSPSARKASKKILEDIFGGFGSAVTATSAPTIDAAGTFAAMGATPVDLATGAGAFGEFGGDVAADIVTSLGTSRGIDAAVAAGIDAGVNAGADAGADAAISLFGADEFADVAMEGGAEYMAADAATGVPYITIARLLGDALGVKEVNNTLNAVTEPISNAVSGVFNSISSFFGW